MASLTTTPATTFQPLAVITTKYEDTSLVDGATTVSDLRIETDGPRGSMTLLGRISLRPRDGGGAVEIPLQMTGSVSLSASTGFGAANLSPTNAAALASLRIESYAKMMCLNDDCSQYFVNIYVRYNGDKSVMYRHQVHQVPEPAKPAVGKSAVGKSAVGNDVRVDENLTPKRSEKSDEKAASKIGQSPAKAAEKSAEKLAESAPKPPKIAPPDFTEEDGSSDYDENDTDENDRPGFYVGEVSADLKNFDIASKPPADTVVKLAVPPAHAPSVNAVVTTRPVTVPVQVTPETLPQAAIEDLNVVIPKPIPPPKGVESKTSPKPESKTSPKSESKTSPKPLITLPPKPVTPAKAQPEAKAVTVPKAPPQPEPKSAAPLKPEAVPAPVRTEAAESKTSIQKVLAQAILFVDGGKLQNASSIYDYQNRQQQPGFRVMNPKKESYFATRDMQNILAFMGQYSLTNVNSYVLSVGDVSFFKGGQLGTHKSHQTGMDADIAYYFNRANSQKGFQDARGNAGWMVDEQWELFKTVVKTGHVDRIFVHPALKQTLCRSAISKGEIRANQTSGAAFETLLRLSPESSHYNHFHLRLVCSSSQPACRDRAPVPRTSGCKF